LGIELLERFELLGYLSEVSAARDSGKVAQKNQHKRPSAEIADVAYAAIWPQQHQVSHNVAWMQLHWFGSYPRPPIDGAPVLAQSRYHSQLEY
jgi:hypothetical protein